MAEIGFYHLLRTGPDQALPQLLGKTLKAGQRATIRVGTAERLAALDTALWLTQESDWLPHGTATTGDAGLQPIWLTTDDDAPNGARYLFLIDNADIQPHDRRVDAYRIVILSKRSDKGN